MLLSKQTHIDRQSYYYYLDMQGKHIVGLFRNETPETLVSVQIKGFTSSCKSEITPNLFIQNASLYLFFSFSCLLKIRRKDFLQC